MLYSVLKNIVPVIMLSVLFGNVHSQNQNEINNSLQKDLVIMSKTLKSLTSLAAIEQNDPLIVLYTATFYSLCKKIRDSNQIKEYKDFFDDLVRVNKEKKADFTYSISLYGLRAESGHFSYAIDLNARPKKEKKSRKQEASQSIIKIMRIPGVDTLTKKFRDLGVDVVVINDDGGLVTDQDTTNYNVIWIGKEVKASKITQVLQVVKMSMPWLRYIFIQYKGEDFGNQIMLGAHNTWVKYLGLKELNKKEFEQLCNPKLSKDEIHALINNYKQ